MRPPSRASHPHRLELLFVHYSSVVDLSFKNSNVCCARTRRCAENP
ncbi:unnamed protein product, partial [Amoebophrya sp. A120]|eukprot:GSA120T00025660001.1